MRRLQCSPGSDDIARRQQRAEYQHALVHHVPTEMPRLRQCRSSAIGIPQRQKRLRQTEVRILRVRPQKDQAAQLCHRTRVVPCLGQRLGQSPANERFFLDRSHTGQCLGRGQVSLIISASQPVDRSQSRPGFGQVGLPIRRHQRLSHSLRLD